MIGRRTLSAVLALFLSTPLLATAEKTAKLESELKDDEAALPDEVARWEVEQKKNSVNWVTLDPRELKATNGAEVAKQEDLSVYASGKNDKGQYTFVAETDLNSITEIRLEMLADERLPSGGPGRAAGGNFVLTEFELTAAPKSNLESAKKIQLQKPMADFSQDSYNIKTAIDGQMPAANNGWAVSPNNGITHWATFELKDALAFSDTAVLTFTLDQQYQDKSHSIGRFRISVTNDERPVGLGLPQSIADILLATAETRTEQQQDDLMEFFKNQDAELTKKAAALLESTKPLPVDPKLKQLKEDVEYTKRPIPEDNQLAQLKCDLAESSKQLANRRLTAAQDLAWALINSPAFLFNH